ncbi:thiol reductant ABC exporter subunit CydC [Polycladidibacter stylochi]|uniref:thiol reductant ABC exporter subunit CydC n=1 Tax=Polycladidibacter stylochi TaxID=1807766 RepID=UPI00083168C0|nr:thiol reductant ABC exporter subunit CydC [Pseudovibrio stylochi]
MKAILILLNRLQKQHPIAFWVGAFVALLPAASGIALLAVSGYFISSAALAAAGGAGLLFNYALFSSRIRTYAILRIFGRYVERVVTHDATFRFLALLRLQVFKGMVARMKQPNHMQRSATALNRIVSDVDQLDGLYLRLALPLFTTLTITALTVFILAHYAPLAAMVIACLQAGTLAILALSATKAERNRAKHIDVSRDALRVRISDLVRGRRDLAIYGGLKRQETKVLKASSRLEEDLITSQHHEQRNLVLVSTLSQVLLAVTFLLAAMAYDQGAMEFKHVALFAFVALALPELLVSTASGAGSWSKMAKAAERVISYTKQTADEPVLTGSDQSAIANAPAIAIAGLSYSYPGSNYAPLKQIDLTVSPGQSLAIIGQSGAGKSTLAAIIARLLPDHTGKISIFGKPLAQIPEAELRQQVIVIGQKTEVFHASIADNLRIAKPEASDAELWQALTVAGLQTRIKAMPEQLETLMGEGGQGLSGGENRRLAMARAFLRQPRIWIADEMTEGLDAQTASQIMQAFWQLSQGSTVLLISHRALELENVNKVYSLQDGVLNDLGKPATPEVQTGLRQD